MADDLMAALQSKLVSYESAGMADHVKRVKARIAELEKSAKAPKPVAAAAGVQVTAEPAKVFGNTVKKTAAPKKAAKKRTK